MKGPFFYKYTGTWFFFIIHISLAIFLGFMKHEWEVIDVITVEIVSPDGNRKQRGGRNY